MPTAAREAEAYLAMSASASEQMKKAAPSSSGGRRSLGTSISTGNGLRSTSDTRRRQSGLGQPTGMQTGGELSELRRRTCELTLGPFNRRKSLGTVTSVRLRKRVLKRHEPLRRALRPIRSPARGDVRRNGLRRHEVHHRERRLAEERGWRFRVE